jgi:hypothetical protein
MPTRWPSPKYEVRHVFRAPLPFVYRWCTDYTPADPKHESEKYDRRILARSARQVVYEDLSDTADGGWAWARHVVRLYPPHRWHSESVGSHRTISLDYRLSRLPGGRTQLVLTGRRRPTALGSKNPTKSNWERSVAETWRRFGRVLERDFRKSGRPGH